jgi:threonine dehydratase
MAGQGTTALELLEDHPDLDALIVPVGGECYKGPCLVIIIIPCVVMGVTSSSLIEMNIKSRPDCS